MTTSRTMSTSFGLSDANSWQPGKYVYFRRRLKNRLYEFVLKQFDRAGISRAELARRMHKKPEQVTRLLAAPGNWTLETLSDLLLAIGNFEPEFSVSSPLAEPARNDNTLALLDAKIHPVKTRTESAVKVMGSTIHVQGTGSNVYPKLTVATGDGQ